MKYKITTHIKIALCCLGDAEINSARRSGLEVFH